MKKDIHPTYYPNATIRCSCGNVIKTGATKSEVIVEICSACHPFYTGKEKLIDTAGRVEKFKKRLAKKQKVKKGKK
jgi:large subunit ribosomal protein L31